MVWKKKQKLKVTLTCTITLPLFLSYSTFTLSGVKKITFMQLNSKFNNDDKYASIVSSNYFENYDKKLTELNFIGTHNSGAYTSKTNGTGYDSNSFMNNLYNSSSTFKKLIGNLGRVQQDSIYNQLLDGTRYLDIRVSNIFSKNGNTNYTIDDIYISHTALYAKLTDFINEVNNFVIDYPNEVIFLDFNHFYTSDGNYEKMQKMIIDYLKRVFGEKLANKNEYKVYDELSKFINPFSPEKNKNILTFFSNKKIYDEYVYTSVNTDKMQVIEYYLKYDSNILVSYWTGENTYRVSEIKNKLKIFLDLKNKYRDALFVSQSFSNWGIFHNIVGFLIGNSGYKIDGWFNRGDEITNYVIKYTNENKIPNIISVNALNYKSYLQEYIFNNFSYK